ncbi:MULTISPECIES: cob(I)yrinic acid a,c-diamide adenosyltransferase [Clostridium]|uniref:Cob(I)yrinic acid a,c-diamide adenosyltransferase n=1 Tax=Clostridium cibarium TaxID=2762247 RepID=A0ABR8PXU6_9CLOT|nr:MULTISPECIES: cob(I)yrinic acid a,c-diamide adenosyltransferase [Clostridium]MBD7912995.1 cob(I)yrinic acid a,c-diamide adenosyltransferase [Clostridium cibarium]
MRGLVHIYCGEGKGKTTTSIGLSVRAAGNGMKVIFTQFLKNNDSSELKILNSIENIDLIPCEESFGFFFNMTDEQKVEAKKVYSSLLTSVLKKSKEADYDMLVLDEIMAAYNYNLVDRDELIEFLKNKPEKLEVVMTGRNPDEKLIELADYVSNIQKIKHPYDKGIFARKGIEM